MDDVKQLGTILGIWAHPDDETFTTAGLMAVAAKNGQKTACVTATHGEAGIYDPQTWPAETLGATREQELADALRIIGVQHHEWLKYVDGTCAEVDDDEAVAKLLSLIEKYTPDTVITFAPDGLTGHEDHKAVSRWVHKAVATSGKLIKLLYAVVPNQAYEQYLRYMDEELNMFFNVDHPDQYTEGECELALNLSDELSKTKCEALRAMPSQTTAMLKAFGTDYICKAFATEYYIVAGNEHTTT